MDISATTSSVKISPRKVRLVADSIRMLSAQKAVDLLSHADKRGASALLKTLKSAMANAKNNARLDSHQLVIKTVNVDEGQKLKRFHPASRGRAHPYKKRTSHIKIILSGEEKGK